MPNYALPFLKGGILNTIFHQTAFQLNIFGVRDRLTFFDLIFFAVLAWAANVLTERLLGKQSFNRLATLVITIAGISLITSVVWLPVGFAVEGVPIVTASLGALAISILCVALSKGKKGETAPSNQGGNETLHNSSGADLGLGGPTDTSGTFGGNQS